MTRMSECHRRCVNVDVDKSECPETWMALNGPTPEIHNFVMNCRGPRFRRREQRAHPGLFLGCVRVEESKPDRSGAVLLLLSVYALKHVWNCQI